MSAGQDIDSMRHSYAGWEKGGRVPFAAAFHPDYVWRLAGHSSWSRRFEGQEAIRQQLIKPLFALFATQYRSQVVNLIAEGDFVVAEVRGDVQTKRGGRYNNEYCIVFKFRGDKIAERSEEHTS